MPTSVFNEYAAATGYLQRVGTNPATAVVTTSVTYGRDATSTPATEWRGCISYDTSVIPVDATLVSASLSIYITAVNVAGSPATKTITTYANWDLVGAALDGGLTEWNNAGSTNIGTFENPGIGDTIVFDLTPVDDMINRSGYTEFRFRKLDSLGAGEAYFIVSATGKCSLTVVYTVPSSHVPVVYTFGG